MTNQDILEIAMRQSAHDSSCNADDFKADVNKVVLSRPNIHARRYLELPFSCDFTSYGNNIVASVSEELAEIADEYIRTFPVEHCFETPNLHVLMERLKPFDMNVCFMAEYFLPDVKILYALECDFETKILRQNDFRELYLPQWSNALCEKRRHLDKLAIGAYAAGKLIGLAACSADCDTMWQIGVDILPEYRRQGAAAALTSKLAVECLSQGIVPFYCCAWSNLKSARNAIKSGLRPAWVQLTIKQKQFIDQMNRN